MKDFYRVKQLSWLKMKPFPNFESSTHSVGEKWPIEFGFIVESLCAQTYPLANQIYVYTCKSFFFAKWYNAYDIKWLKKFSDNA